VWHSPVGNLAASLLTVVRVPAAEAATLGFVAGLALATALDAVVPAPALRIGVDGGTAGEGGRIALKWPNDVVVGGAKIAGILVEAEELADGARAIVVGIGVNVVAAPEGLPYAATSLAALGAQTSAEALFQALAEAWLPLARQWREEGGFAALRAAWLARASGFGAATAVQHGGTVVRGTFETIDDSGRLIVRGVDGARHAIAAGEVHFGAAATATAG
jgi:BirA family biotin operon repressor/biotin-[acetyl-CoA-carboxylase] ligase